MSAIAPQAGSLPIQEVELTLSGMTCAACAARIEKTLNAIDGVEAAVNYATESAMVAFTGADVSEETLIKAVSSAGYGARVMDDQPVDDDLDQRLRALRLRLTVSVVLSVPVVLLSMVPALEFRGWQWWAFAFSLPVATWGAWPFHRVAALNARHRTASMDTLISVGVIAAMAWSIWALVWGDAIGTTMVMDGMDMSHGGNTHVYFEVGATVTAFILTGRYLETRAKHTAGDALRSLLALGAKFATVVRDGVETSIPASVVRMDDMVVVRPGEKIAVDGVSYGGRDFDRMTVVQELKDALPKTWGSPTMAPHCDDEKKYGIVEKVVKHFEAMKAKNETLLGQPIRDLVTVNGVRVTVQDGTWGLVRASSNKPELVVVVESPVSDARMREMFKAVDGVLRTHPEVGAYNQTI